MELYYVTGKYKEYIIRLKSNGGFSWERTTWRVKPKLQQKDRITLYDNPGVSWATYYENRPGYYRIPNKSAEQAIGELDEHV